MHCNKTCNADLGTIHMLRQHNFGLFLAHPPTTRNIIFIRTKYFTFQNLRTISIGFGNQGPKNGNCFYNHKRNSLNHTHKMIDFETTKLACPWTLERLETQAFSSFFPIPVKGQLCSKCLFGVFYSPKKTQRKQFNLSYHSSKVIFLGFFEN